MYLLNGNSILKYNYGSKEYSTLAETALDISVGGHDDTLWIISTDERTSFQGNSIKHCNLSQGSSFIELLDAP